MSFTSLTFILFFVPAAAVGFHLLSFHSRKLADWYLILMSLVFYAKAGADCLLVLLLSLAVTYLCHLGNVGKAGEGRRKAFLVLGIAVNLGLLGIFKYTGFVLQNIGLLTGTQMPEVRLFLPLGISFVAFGQISFLVDAAKDGERRGLRDYLLYALFFPKVTQGPIMLYRDWEQEHRKKCEGKHSIDYRLLNRGIILFAAGLAKKIFLADVFGGAVDWGFQNMSLLTRADTLVIMVSYSLQIYFDFSGYSDMASGLAALLGFELPVNFDSPYQAESVTDFWRRWHMSLTAFFREYVYFPLGGSRRGKLRTYGNILIVFLLSGLWHGANWTFVVWGLVHGCFQVAERFLGKIFLAVPVVLRRIYTFAVATVLWTLFRCPDFAEFERIRWHLLVDEAMIINPMILDCFRIPGIRLGLSLLHVPYGEAAVSHAGVVLYLAAGLFLSMGVPNLQRRELPRNLAVLLAALVFLLAGILSLGGVSTFVYNSF